MMIKFFISNLCFLSKNLNPIYMIMVSISKIKGITFCVQNVDIPPISKALFLNITCKIPTSFHEARHIIIISKNLKKCSFVSNDTKIKLKTFQVGQ